MIDHRKTLASCLPSFYARPSFWIALAFLCAVGPIAAAGDTPLDHDLRHAAAAGDAIRVGELLAAGADVNSQTGDGITPLMAAVVGDVERLRHIVENGLGKNLRRDIKKITRAISGDAATVRVLLDHGARPGQATRRGITPLALAALGGRAAMLSALLQAGAPVNQQARRGETALMVAALAGHYGVAERLLAAGADPHLATKDGITAALAALLGRHPKIAALIGKSANKN